MFKLAVAGLIASANALLIGTPLTTRHACASISMDDGPQAGTCKWFNVEKGYGFIALDGGDESDVFVHQSDIYAPGFRVRARLPRTRRGATPARALFFASPL